MDTTPILGCLRTNARVIRELVGGVSPDDARRPGGDNAWSIVEIVAHLADEEAEDFRTRLRLTLEEPETAWPPIDPEGVARERMYNERDLTVELDRFTREREASLAWLDTLGDPDWSRAHNHPRFGPIRAGDLLVSWADHDVLHIRQLARRVHELIIANGAPYATDYAGQIGQ